MICGYTWPDRNDEDENWFEIYDYDGNLVQKIDLYPHDDIDIISADEKICFCLLDTGTRWCRTRGNRCDRT